MSVTEPTSGWRSTGLHWESQTPVLTAVPADLARSAGRRNSEHRRVINIGTRIAWGLRGPRRCTGLWTGISRTPCPAQAELADSTDPQCTACAAATPGRALARDAALGDDGRAYVLYLAWFGPGLIKVGLTAADRGSDRLLEQGAITWTPLAQDAYTPIRQAERLTAAAGLAPERVAGRAKASAWWALPPACERARELASAHAAITIGAAWPSRLDPKPCAVADQAARFGLDRPVPMTYQEVTGLADSVVLAGEIQFIIGRRLLIDTASGPLLIDMRRVAGWAVTTPGRDVGAVAKTVIRSCPEAAHAGQDTLF
jgi:hypothetical protein